MQLFLEKRLIESTLKGKRAPKKMTPAGKNPGKNAYLVASSAKNQS